MERKSIMLLRRLIPNQVRHSWPYQIVRHIVRPHDKIYDATYYEDVESSAEKTADAMAESFITRSRPTRVIDVGCGTGALLDRFRSLGCQVHGLEYSEAALR